MSWIYKFFCQTKKAWWHDAISILLITPETFGKHAWVKKWHLKLHSCLPNNLWKNQNPKSEIPPYLGFGTHNQTQPWLVLQPNRCDFSCDFGDRRCVCWRRTGCHLRQTGTGRGSSFQYLMTSSWRCGKLWLTSPVSRQGRVRVCAFRP